MIYNLMEELRTMAEDHDDELCQEALGYIEKLEKERDYFQQQYVRKCEHEFEVRRRIEQLEAALLEPTLDMLIAGKKSLYSCSEDPELDDARKCFKAMIAALGERQDGN
jgi:hypothetical protein